MWSESRAAEQERRIGAVQAEAEAVGSAERLGDAIQLAAELLDHSPERHPRRAFRLAMLAFLLMERYEWEGRDTADIVTARELSEYILRALPGDLAQFSLAASVCGQAQFMYGEVFDDRAVLEQARETLTVTYRAFTTDTQWQAVMDARVDSMLCSVELNLFTDSGDTACLDRAVEYGRKAATLPGATRVQSLSNLSLALRMRFESRGVPADLDEAHECLTAALEELPRQMRGLRPLLRSNLGGVLLARYDVAGDPGILDLAVAELRGSVEESPAGDNRLRVRLANLSLALRLRYDSTGRLADLDAAVAAGRKAALPGETSRGRSVHQTLALTSALLRRADHTGEPADAHEAVRAARQAVESLPDGHSDLPSALAVLGYTLGSRHQWSRDRSDLDEAVAALRRAVGIGSPHFAETASHRSALALLLTDRAELADGTGGPPGGSSESEALKSARADLDEAVELLRRALGTTEADHHDHASWQSNLAVALRGRYKLTSDPRDLDEAITLISGLLRSGRLNETERTGKMNNLALALRDRARLRGAEADRRKAIALWKLTVDDPAQRPGLRAGAAVQWGREAAALGDWADATDGYAHAVGLLPEVAWHGIDWTGRERQLETWGRYGVEAAACAIASGRPELALELLERGRNVLWTQTLQLRSDTTELWERAPELARQLEETRTAMEQNAHRGLTVPRAVAGGEGLSPGLRVDRQQALARRWDELLAEVRALPGFSSYLLPPPAAELTGAARGGPVAVLNISEHRCDALLVTTAGVRVLPLEVTAREVRRQCAVFLRATSPAEEDAPERGTAEDNDAVNDVLAWLYQRIAGPVLDALGIPARPAPGSLPRIWWCPTGVLSFLPLHAAGIHRTRAGARPATVLDRAVSSYTPTLRALGGAGRLPAGGLRTPGAGLLVVDIGDTPGQQPLPGAAAEGRALRELFPAARRLSGRQATGDAVVAALGRAEWAHFACHGSQDPSTPSGAGLVMHDRLVSIGELASVRRGTPGAAFLSACDTVRGGVDLADESITLGAALQLAGWREVVGTLYSANDRTAHLLVSQVYERLAPGGDVPLSTALHEAVLRLRDYFPELPVLWSHFVHIGP